MKIKKTEEIIFKALMYISVAFITSSLFLIVLSIFYKGLPSMSWEMISQTPKGGFYFGKEGGILNAIIGSIYLAIGSTFLALLIGLPVALYMNIYLIKRKKIVSHKEIIFNPFI